ncbi:MAG: dUTP diphosphatase [Pyrinomonadaceae bacterium]
MSDSKYSLKFKSLDSRAVLPTRGTQLSAGLDLFCIDELHIAPQSRIGAHTGLSVAIPEGFYGRVAPRSGLAARYGLDVLSGVIDADYRGEVICLLYNTGDEIIVLPAGSKICQLIIEQVIMPTPAWADELEETARGAGGFGSTGA